MPKTTDFILWDYIHTGLPYSFDTSYTRDGRRVREMVRGVVKDKLLEKDGRRYILLENNVAIHFESIDRVLGPSVIEFQLA